MATTTLYRFFDRHDRLLYVGIAGNPARRHHEHSKEKPWWADVARSTMEHFATREEAAAAEVAAIKNEAPLHNVVHNVRGGKKAEDCTHRWRPAEPSGPFLIHDQYGGSFVTRLVLRPEPHLSPCVDAVTGQVSDPWDQGRREVEFWFDRLAKDNGGTVPEVVGIYWVVDGLDSGRVFDTAPLGHVWGNTYPEGDDFLHHFSHPTCIATGQPLNWFHLPVVMDRFPLWADTLGWLPSPLQRECPARALHDAYDGLARAMVRGDAQVHKTPQNVADEEWAWQTFGHILDGRLPVGAVLGNATTARRQILEPLLRNAGWDLTHA